MPPLNISKMAKDMDEKADSVKPPEPLILLQQDPSAQHPSPATATAQHDQPSFEQPGPTSPKSPDNGPLQVIEEDEGEKSSESQEGINEPDQPEDEAGSTDEEGGEEHGLMSKKPPITVQRKRTRTLPSHFPVQLQPHNHQQEVPVLPQNLVPENNQDDNQDQSDGEDDDEGYDDFNDKWDPELELGPDDIPEPPDGGYGWVIVAASFLCNVVVDGIAYSFGVFFMEFVNYYDAPVGTTAWVGSLLSGCYLSAGPLVSALTNKFGCRPVTIAGSIVSCVAFVLSTFSPSISILMITYGVMGGIGFGLIYLPAIVSVGYYFSTKRALATGIAVCGSGVGAFVLAPVCEKLLDVYDWKGTMLIMAGLSLNCVVFGALMRPLEAGKPKAARDRYGKPLLQRIAEEKERLRFASLCNSQFFLVQHADGTVEKRAKVLMNMEPGVHSTLNLDQFGKSPAETPVVTLSPIEEVRRSPAGSKDGESSSEEKLHQPPPAITTTIVDSPAVSAVQTPTAGVPPALQVSTPNGGSMQALTTPGIREIAKRKGLIHAHNTSTNTGGRVGSMKISVSNITVNGELPQRKTSVPNNVHLSSSGYLCPGNGNRNNNYLVEEVWKKLQLEESQVPLDGTKPVIKRPTKKDFARPMYRKDIFYSGSILNLPEYNSSKDVRSYISSVISIPRDATAPGASAYQVQGEEPDQTANVLPAKAQGCCAPCMGLMPKSMTDTMKETLNFSLLKDPVFLLICISNIFGMLGFYIPFVFITNSSVAKGIPSDQAAFLLSIIGITNTCGRLLFGWLSDRPSVDALFVNNVCLTLSGFCILVIPFCHTYGTLVADCTLFGVFVSAYICLTSIILVDLLGLDRLTNAFGILSLFRGSASIIGPPIAGTIYDMTGSYDLPFFVSGSLLIFSAALSFMVPCVRRYVDNKQWESSNEKDMEEGEVDVNVVGQNGADKQVRRRKSSVNQIVSVV